MQKAGSFARFILTKIYGRNEDAGKTQHSSEALHFSFTHAECISLVMWVHARSISARKREMVTG